MHDKLFWQTDNCRVYGMNKIVLVNKIAFFLVYIRNFTLNRHSKKRSPSIDGYIYNSYIFHYKVGQNLVKL